MVGVALTSRVAVSPNPDRTNQASSPAKGYRLEGKARLGWGALGL